ncbi:MAG: M28 family peptidase [Gemmatimonadaceae bacterium]
MAPAEAPAPAARTELARTHLARLAAEPRPAGSDAEARARAHCAATLRALGFGVAERPFAYSAFPGRYGTAAGGVTSIGALATAALCGWRGAPGTALAVLVAAGAVLAAAGLWMARRGVLDAPVARARGVNLEATRGGDAPRLWLVAHLDSKSQPVPIAGRAAGVVGSAAAWVAALALAVAQLAGVVGGGWWPWVGAIGVVAGIPVAASVVGARSAGAVDNASGAAAVLVAAAFLPADASVGVLLTSAEELGLAGARAWAATRDRGGVALNCDGVDDAGRVTCMYTGRPPRRVLGAAAGAAAALRAPAPRPRRLLPGILTDGVALADRGWEVATLSKGTLRTLARIHTSRDSLDALRGEGVTEVGALIAAMARHLLGSTEPGRAGD